MFRMVLWTLNDVTILNLLNKQQGLVQQSCISCRVKIPIPRRKLFPDSNLRNLRLRKSFCNFTVYQKKLFFIIKNLDAQVINDNILCFCLELTVKKLVALL